jgi:hypothetical protein
MGIDRQQSAAEMPGGLAELAQSDLQVLGVGHGVGGEEGVDGAIAGEERQAVEHFKTALAEGALLADAREAEGGFMDELEGQARLDAVAGTVGPGAEQVPGAQAQVFRDQQPRTDEVAVDLVGQELANAPFETARIAGFRFAVRGRALRFQLQGRIVRWVAMEFFFAGRTVR